MNIQNPNSLDAIDKAVLLHPYTDLDAHADRGPHIIERAEGIRLYDSDGRAYIDGVAGLWCTALGFGEDRLVEAAAKAMKTLSFSHVFSHRSHPAAIELAERLTKAAPDSISRAFFVNSGSEAVDAAIQIVWNYNNALGRPEKKKIIGRDRGYHGVTIGAGSLTALAYKQADFDLPYGDRFLRVTCPHHYRYAEPGESEADFTARLARELENLIVAEGAENIGAFIGEPMMAAGGIIPPPEGYWPAMAEVCRRHDVLVICDEIVNGFCRTGEYWGCETFGVQPDMMTCAKQLSSAYLPIGATLMSEEIYSVIAKHSPKNGVFGIGMTYGGHPVCTAVALETLKIYEERDMLGHVQAIAPHFAKRLAKLGEHPMVGQARGRGLLGAIELVADKETKEPFPPGHKAAPTLYNHVAEHGVLCRALPGDALGICPPMIVTESDLDEIFDAIEKGLDSAHAALTA